MNQRDFDNKRDEFAMAALPGIMARIEGQPANKTQLAELNDAVADAAYGVADAMMRRRTNQT